MILTKEIFSEFCQEEDSENIKTIIIFDYNIEKINNNCLLKNLEYLSLQNNKIKEISFIENLTFLWYFDIRNNPVENFEILNNKNFFGFLGITLNDENSNSFLKLKNLNLGFLYYNFHEMDENKNFELFFKRSNNVLKINNEFNNLNKEIYFENLEIKNSNQNLNYKIRVLYDFFNKQNLYNSDLKDFKSKDGNSSCKTFYNYSNSKSNSGFFTENNKKDKILFEIEKEKLLTNIKLLKFFIELKKNTNYVLNIKSTSKLNDPITDFFCNENDIIKNFEFDFNFFLIKDTEKQLIILILLALYVLNILDKECAFLILNELIKNENSDCNDNPISEINVSENLNLFLSFKLETKLCFYYETVEKVRSINSKDKLKNSIFLNEGKLEELFDILEMRTVLINKKYLINRNNLFSSKFFNKEKHEKEKDSKLFKEFIKEKIIKPIRYEFKFHEEIAILLDILKNYLSNNNIEINNLNKKNYGIDSNSKDKKNFDKIFNITNKAAYKYLKKKYKEKNSKTTTNFFVCSKYPNLSKNIISKIMMKKSDILNIDEDEDENENKNEKENRLIDFFNNENNFFEEIDENKFSQQISPIKKNSVLIKSHQKLSFGKIKSTNSNNSKKENFSHSQNMHETSTSLSSSISNQKIKKEKLKYEQENHFSHKKIILINSQTSDNKKNKDYDNNHENNNLNSNLDITKSSNFLRIEENLSIDENQKLLGVHKSNRRRNNNTDDAYFLSPQNNNELQKSRQLLKNNDNFNYFNSSSNKSFIKSKIFQSLNCDSFELNKDKLNKSGNLNFENSNNKNDNAKINNDHKISNFTNENLKKVFKNNQAECSRPISREQDNNYFISSNNANFNMNNHIPKNFNSNNNSENAKRFIFANLNSFENNDFLHNYNTSKNIYGNHFTLNSKEKENKNYLTNKNLCNVNMKENILNNFTNNVYKYSNEGQLNSFQNNNKYSSNLTFENSNNLKNNNVPKFPIILKNKDNIEYNLNKIEELNKTKNSNFTNISSYNHFQNNKFNFEQFPLDLYNSYKNNLMKFKSENNIPKLTNELFNFSKENNFEFDKISKITKKGLGDFFDETKKDINTNETTYRYSEYDSAKNNNLNNISKIATQTEDFNLNKTCQTINKSKPKKIKIGCTLYKNEQKDNDSVKKEPKDFRSNIKKLIHHWNRNNKNLNNGENANIKENEFDKLQKRQKTLPKLVIPNEEVSNLFYIENKDLEIQKTLSKKPKK